MPAHRKPTAVLEATGAYERNPGRRRGRELEPTPTGPIGDPPAYFDANHREAWAELARTAPAGVLASSDRLHLEITTRLLVRMRLAPGRLPKWLIKLGEVLAGFGWDGREVQEMTDVFRGAIGVSAQEQQLLSQCLVRMGMTPADRSKVSETRSTEPEADTLAIAMQKLAQSRVQ